MERVSIKDTNLKWDCQLTERYETSLIILHHTGSIKDIDASAYDIHQWHIGSGYAGIGYHFVIRKDGTIERGRPLWALGAHAYGENWRSIGVHLSGDFSGKEKPTMSQIESAAMLIANLCENYEIPTDRQHILGHREVCETDCPGKNLFARLDEIVGKANWYRYGEVKPDVTDAPKHEDFMLSEHFSAEEFRCKGQYQHTCNCHGRIKVKHRLIELLEQLRELCGNRPLYINSGYRCPTHNAAVGGAASSQHCLGTAADVSRPAGMTFEDFVSAVKQLSFDGIGLYPGDDFIHVDIRDGGIGNVNCWEQD